MPSAGGQPLIALSPSPPSRLTTFAATDAPVIGGTLTGLGSNVIEPSDTQVAVGATDVVEMVNSNVEYWATNGASEGNDSLGSYFTDSTNDRRIDQMTDPRVLYDTLSGRFFASVLDLTRSQIVLVISPTARPGSGAWLYSFPSFGCQDQPRLGISDALVALGDDLFTDCGTYGRRVGGEVTVMSKADLISGAQLHSETYGPDALYSSITPVISLSPTPILWFASSDFFFDSIDLFAADKVNASALALRRVPVQPLFEVPSSLQSDPALIDSGDNRVQNAVWENNRLLLAISNGCLINGEVGTFACARYIGIDTTNTASPSVTMDATIALNQNRDMFYPTVMPASDGTIYSVFGYSSAGETPSIGILTNPAQPTTWNIVTAGTGANESGRWGDYFGIARDPTDPTHIWVAASYGTGGGGWSTTLAAIGSTPFAIKPPTPTPPPTPPAATPKPRSKPKPKPKKHKRSLAHRLSQGTRIVVYRPFSISGRLASDVTATRTLSGSCWSGSEAAERSDAWRCSAGNNIYDPCYSGGPPTTLACPRNRTGSKVLFLRLTAPLPTARGNPPLNTNRALPAQMRLKSGVICGFAGGATATLAGQRLNYACSNGAWLVGGPSRATATWSILYLRSLDSSSATRMGISTAWF